MLCKHKRKERSRRGIGQIGLNLGPTVIDVEDLGCAVELIDCGVGLWITNVDPILRVRGKKLNLDVNFDVGLVSVSWGVLAKTSREDIFQSRSIMLRGVAITLKIRHAGIVFGIYVPSSTSYTARGNVHMGTILSPNKNRHEIERQPPPEFTDYLGYPPVSFVVLLCAESRTAQSSSIKS